MGWQLVLVALVVAAAACYLVRSTWRTWSAKRGCGGGCGCGKAAAPAGDGHATLIPAEQLTLRQRPPDRP